MSYHLYSGEYNAKLGIACLWFLTAVFASFSLNLGFSQAMLAQSNVFQISPFFRDSMGAAAKKFRAGMGCRYPRG